MKRGHWVYCHFHEIMQTILWEHKAARCCHVSQGVCCMHGGSA